MTATSFSIAGPIANDDTPMVDVVSGHLMRRRMERRIMLGVAVLASLVLLATLLQGYHALQPMPDLVTFAARV